MSAMDDANMIDVALESQSVRRPLVTLAVRAGATRLLVDLGFAPIWEMTLANGRRADICGLGPKGEVVIVEVKSGIEDFRVDMKWHEYAPYCDRFFFAIAPDFPLELLDAVPSGVIVADGFGAGVIREAPAHPLVPARRKAVTLAFARHAAIRCLRAPAADQAS
jgi:hypothetical protein